jgi:ABC-type transporter Mla subunit MlaD
MRDNGGSIRRLSSPAVAGSPQQSSNGGVVVNSSKFLETTQREHGSLADTLDHLNELISALDRRMPQVQRAGEASIASAAAQLRSEAIRRIGEIQRQIKQA